MNLEGELDKSVQSFERASISVAGAGQWSLAGFALDFKVTYNGFGIC